MNTQQDSAQGNKYLTRAMLAKVINEGEKHGFNRQLRPSVLEDMQNRRVPVVSVLEHDHIAGRLAKVHCRCGIEVTIKGETSPRYLMVDMTSRRYDSLPIIHAT